VCTRVFKFVHVSECGTVKPDQKDVHIQRRYDVNPEKCHERAGGFRCCRENDGDIYEGERNDADNIQLICGQKNMQSVEQQF